MLTVQCILFYYPFKDGKESKPFELGNNNKGNNKRKVSAMFENTKKKQKKELVNNPDDDDDDDDDFENNGYMEPVEPVESSDLSSTLHKLHDTSTFSIFWQNRLVPESVINKLPLFKNIKVTDLDCDNAGIARKWRDRLKGFLFFDWNFHSISNNKLKFTLEPSLEIYLNNLLDKELIWTPSTATNLFEKYVIMSVIVG